MKRIAWLLIICVSLVAGRPAGVGSLAGGSEFRGLILAPKVSDNIALLFDQFDTELVLCLEGEWRGPDLHITDFRIPHILTSESGRVQAAACAADQNTVGTWHNHPAPGYTISTASSTLLSRNCYLSRTDIADFQRRNDAVVSVVSCAPDVYAYWKRDDVDAVTTEIALLPPPDGQLVHSETADGGAASLTQARGR